MDREQRVIRNSATQEKLVVVVVGQFKGIGEWGVGGVNSIRNFLSHG